ncbi:MAG: DUF707 domain-containing protein [Chitinophagaceae bacterium]
MDRKYIVIAPCGNRSFLFNECWLKQKEIKNFDLCLMFYHEEIADASLYSAAEYFFHLRGFKYHMIYQLLTAIQPEWLEKYDYFYFLDDDINIETAEINKMFSLSSLFDISISQASLSKDSFCSWPMFKHHSNSFCRFVGQIEVMAPLFGKDALKLCLPSFISNRSSWGIDSVWSKILGYPKEKLIVFDSVIMQHTLPVGRGELYEKIGVNPYDEWMAVTHQYNAKKHNYQEYGRLQLVNSKNNRVKFFYYKCSEFFSRGKQSINDFDLASRIKNQMNKLFNRKKKEAKKGL